MTQDLTKLSMKQLQALFDAAMLTTDENDICGQVLREMNNRKRQKDKKTTQKTNQLS